MNYDVDAGLMAEFLAGRLRIAVDTQEKYDALTAYLYSEHKLDFMTGRNNFLPYRENTYLVCRVGQILLCGNRESETKHPSLVQFETVFRAPVPPAAFDDLF